MPVRVQGFAGGGVFVLGAVLATMLHQPAMGAGEPPAQSARITVRKCVEAGGRIAYQSQPCTGRSVEAWTREAPLESKGVATTDVGARPRAAARSGTPPAHRPARAGSSRRQRCAAARTEATRRRDREWNRLGFDALSKLDAWVAEQCR